MLRRFALVAAIACVALLALRPVTAQNTRAAVLDAAQIHGVPTALMISVACVESGLSRPPRGRYVGQRQILPATARGMGRSVATCAAALGLNMALRKAGRSLGGVATLFTCGIGGEGLYKPRDAQGGYRDSQLGCRCATGSRPSVTFRNKANALASASVSPVWSGRGQRPSVVTIDHVPPRA